MRDADGGDDAAVDHAGLGLGEHPAGDGSDAVAVVGVERDGDGSAGDGGVVADQLLEEPVHVDDPAVVVEQEHADREVVGQLAEGRVGVGQHEGTGSLGGVGQVDRGSNGQLGHRGTSFMLGGSARFLRPRFDHGAPGHRRSGRGSRHDHR